jgi:predicted metal-dependent hydrolase
MAGRQMTNARIQEIFHLGFGDFNAGRFFAAHETWEEIWLHSAEPEKTLLQGLIQIAAGFHHVSKDNPEGGCALLTAGIVKLGRSPARYRGTRVRELREAARIWVVELQAGRSPARETMPQLLQE